MGLRNSEQRTKEFDDPQVFDNQKGISIGSMDFDNPKVFGDTSITALMVLFRFVLYLRYLPITFLLQSGPQRGQPDFGHLCRKEIQRGFLLLKITCSCRQQVRSNTGRQVLSSG